MPRRELLTAAQREALLAFPDEGGKESFWRSAGGSPGIQLWARYGNDGKSQFAQPPVNELLRKAQPFGHSSCRT